MVAGFFVGWLLLEDVVVDGLTRSDSKNGARKAIIISSLK